MFGLICAGGDRERLRKLRLPHRREPIHWWPDLPIISPPLLTLKLGCSQEVTENAWKLRLPNEWEPIRWWSDLLTWRCQVHNSTINMFKQVEVSSCCFLITAINFE